MPYINALKRGQLYDPIRELLLERWSERLLDENFHFLHFLPLVGDEAEESVPFWLSWGLRNRKGLLFLSSQGLTTQRFSTKFIFLLYNNNNKRSMYWGTEIEKDLLSLTVVSKCPNSWRTIVDSTQHSAYLYRVVEVIQISAYATFLLSTTKSTSQTNYSKVGVR